MKFCVEIVEEYRRTIMVDAEDSDQAYEFVDEAVNEGTIDLPCDGDGYRYSRELFVKENPSLTTEEKIEALNSKIGYDYFLPCMGEKCIDFYYKHLNEDFSLIDIDGYANLNTLFGYDIGIEAMLQLTGYFYERGTEIIEFDIDSKQELLDACKELGLNLDFSKWRIEKFDVYEYY